MLALGGDPPRDIQNYNRKADAFQHAAGGRAVAPLCDGVAVQFHGKGEVSLYFPCASESIPAVLSPISLC